MSPLEPRSWGRAVCIIPRRRTGRRPWLRGVVNISQVKSTTHTPRLECERLARLREGTISRRNTEYAPSSTIHPDSAADTRSGLRRVWRPRAVIEISVKNRHSFVSLACSLRGRVGMTAIADCKAFAVGGYPPTLRAKRSGETKAPIADSANDKDTYSNVASLRRKFKR